VRNRDTGLERIKEITQDIYNYNSARKTEHYNRPRVRQIGKSSTVPNSTPLMALGAL
jgi:hypothetical protein